MEGILVTSFQDLQNSKDNITTQIQCGFGNSSGCSWNATFGASDAPESSDILSEKVYWALMMIPLPLVAVVGNILVMLSVYKEKSLQTATNYFIVSLAFADLLVAAVVMPFAVYVLVNVDWELSETLCDFYIALDVTCSTASIFNLVAISIDRFIAVTQPIKYSKHKNNKRVFLTIAIVWLVSAAIGSPIVLGLNTSPERIPNLCVFYNSDFIIYSSLSSFYIPCIVMVYLYYKIFRAIHERARKAIGKKLPTKSAISQALVIENDTQIEKEEYSVPLERKTELEKPLQKLSPLVEADELNHQCIANPEELANSNEEDDDDEDIDPTVDDECQIIKNQVAGQFILNDVQRGKPYCNESQQPQLEPLLQSHSDQEMPEKETQFCVRNPHTESPARTVNSDQSSTSDVSLKANGAPMGTSSSTVDAKIISVGFGETKRKNEMVESKPVKKEKKKSRFSLVRHQKSSKKKREKNAARRERKATKTLAIVLGMFLMCWVPFFTCNILDAICIKLQSDQCRPGVTAFLLTTWLGYINSCVNPVIYTIFNMEFRKAFKKLLLVSCK